MSEYEVLEIVMLAILVSAILCTIAGCIGWGIAGHMIKRRKHDRQV